MSSGQDDKLASADIIICVLCNVLFALLPWGIVEGIDTRSSSNVLIAEMEKADPVDCTS